MTALFDIVESNIQNAATGEIIPGKKALFVDDKCVNIVSEAKYKVVQPRIIHDQFEAKSGLEITNVLTNPNHGSMLLSAKYQNLKILGEEHDLSLTFYTGHNNQYCTFLTLQALRLACLNQVPALVGSPNLHIVRCKHIHNFDFDQLGDIIETLPLRIANFELQMERLKDTKLTLDDFLSAYVDFFKLEDTARQDKTISSITDLYHSAKGQDIITDDTAYKAFHTLTYDMTHNAKRSVNRLEKVNIQNQKTVHKFFNYMESEGLLAA